MQVKVRTNERFDAFQYFNDMGEHTAVVPVWFIKACVSGEVNCRGNQTFLRSKAKGSGDTEIHDGDWILRHAGTKELFVIRNQDFGLNYEEVPEGISVSILPSSEDWLPISSAPRDGTYIILGGPSGYSTTPILAVVGHWDPEFRPRNPWVCWDSSVFSDYSGGDPCCWRPLPSNSEEALTFPVDE